MTFEVKRRLNAFVDLSSTDLTTLYTCPTNKTAVIKEIFICNVDTTNSTDITIAITDTSASTTFNLIKTKTVGNDDFLRLDSADIILESGDIIKAQANADNDLEVSAFIEEYPDPMR